MMFKKLNEIRKADNDVLETERYHAGQNLFRSPFLERFSRCVLFVNIQTTYGMVTTFLGVAQIYTIHTFHLWFNVDWLQFHCFQT